MRFLVQEHPQLKGWRKLDYWKRRIKNGFRSIYYASLGGGKNKEQQLNKAAGKYIAVAMQVGRKRHRSARNFIPSSLMDEAKLMVMKQFIVYLSLFQNSRVLKEVRSNHESMGF